MVNELIVAFLGSLPLVTRPQSRPIAPLLSCTSTVTARAPGVFRRQRQIQSRRLNTRYSTTLTISISTSASGYPSRQSSSGMWLKFIP